MVSNHAPSGNLSLNLTFPTTKQPLRVVGILRSAGIEPSRTGDGTCSTGSRTLRESASNGRLERVVRRGSSRAGSRATDSVRD